ncbi:ATP-binding cassette domain-containing protein [Demequina zhanjiangensis]|uniref:ATP-binding cassette domain-containing protein n=1 Tax=Demequina zhanjiangensis TaxID=3051659 RepID=A0ABT8G4Y9_9MICO|nr:ATP-binding cassette domain-containing protein [Demequina sp. SYSU T00b26]MDN4474188.1 ATP-binding cassette domain-containing protein [Demequina sp. SYSU T00b26]
MPTAPLLKARDLKVSYPVRGFRKRPIEIVHGVDFEIAAGETYGVVGESGSGKTTIGRAVLGLASVSGGTVEFDGRDISHLSPGERRAMAKDIQVVFQDPYSSLNPALTVGEIIAEPLVVQGSTPKDARRRTLELLDSVGLPSDAADRLPREFSGGQRQRVAIARALAPEPRLIVCDEPVSALDLSTQSKVLDLLLDIQRRTGVAYLFVSHDLAVVRHISHRVGVVYRGEIVEQGPASRVTLAPDHPYTQRLLLAAPVADPIAQEKRRADRIRLRDEQRLREARAGAA